MFQDHEKKANLVEDKEVKMEPDLLIAIKEKEKEGNRSWYISWQLYEWSYVWDKDNFVEIDDQEVNGYVPFGDSSMISIRRKCEILIHLKNGEQWIIQNVYYESKLKSNIQSLWQLWDKGNEYFFMKARNLMLVDSIGN